MSSIHGPDPKFVYRKDKNFGQENQCCELRDCLVTNQMGQVETTRVVGGSPFFP